MQTSTSVPSLRAINRVLLPWEEAADLCSLLLIGLYGAFPLVMAVPTTGVLIWAGSILVSLGTLAFCVRRTTAATATKAD